MAEDTQTKEKAKKHDKTPIPEREPHFDKLEFLYEEDYPDQTKGDIFDKWAGLIAPDEPQISKKQFLNWTRNKHAVKERVEVAELQESGMKKLTKYKNLELRKLEQKVRIGRGMILDDVLGEMNKEGRQSLKERYYNLSVISQSEKGLQKEKDIAIKKQKENREAVGMFASLANQAMTGELTTDDAELLESADDEQE